MRPRQLAALAAAFVGVGVFAPLTALATPIVAGSQIDFGGGINPLGGPLNPDGSSNVYTSTGVDFRTSGAASPGIAGTLGITNTNSASFSVFSAAACPSPVVGGCGTITDLLSYNVGSETLINPALPVSDFLTFTQGAYTATFDLQSFLVTEYLPTATQLGTFILSGVGILNLNGFDSTPGIVTLSSQGPSNTSFSGSVVAQPVPVPEPASTLLLGAGLLGLGLFRSRRARRDTVRHNGTAPS